METSLVFGWLISKDFIGQYYGLGLDSLKTPEADPSEYRRLAFAVLGTISTDSLTIMRGQHLSSPVDSISYVANVSFVSEVIKIDPLAANLAYVNGTKPGWSAEADAIYLRTIVNLIAVVAHTVNLDLGSAGPESIYRNSSALKNTIGPNLAPWPISPSSWAQQGRSFYYGPVTDPYHTWAQMLLAGQGVTLGTVTGLPQNSTMVTTYLCPVYRTKRMGAFLTSVFVGASSMFLSAWAAWMFITAFAAKYIEEPCESACVFRRVPSCDLIESL